ncbi:disulfide isomerase DsbC N-terminal domain-containing protein [Pantoea ananatis]|uniref:disulfide isomerase DsbC N-terminal domain-containing protein n=1 Tax=Pantoea ananas TaxID=553 RepID=UPI000B7D2909|nr:thioredoxin fold domain-containing protein [Pantoea ananatis]
MIGKKHFIAAAVSLSLAASIAHAQQDAQSTNPENVAHAQQKSIAQKDIDAAQAELKASFSQLNVTDFSQSPLPGIFQLQTGGNIMYFAPETPEHEGVLIFGEMYNKNGENLTEKSKNQLIGKTIKTIDFSSAISIGPANAPAYYEFTDPDCPYCHAYDNWLKQTDPDGALHRKLIFMVNPGHPLARAKIEHIICSDNKDEAVKYAFSDALPHESLEQATALQVANYKSLKTCAQADSVIKEHQEIISKLGVNGTPSFLFGAETNNPVKVVGFAKDKILDNITKLKTTSATSTKAAK